MVPSLDTFYRYAIRTPLVRFRGKGDAWGEIWLKDETKQVTRAFKFRGNLYNLLGMPRETHVVTASTGNHGLGLSTAADLLGLHARVFLPSSTPRTKLDAIIAAGAEVTMIDGDYDTCKARAIAFAASNAATYIPSFDDPQIIRGHRSLFRELEKQHPEAFDAIFVPVGGGGLLAACIDHFATKDVQIVGVELDTAPAMYLSLRAGTRVELPEARGRAEGLLVRSVGVIPFTAAVRASRVEIALVSDADIRQAMRSLWYANQIKAEGAGAAALAAALHYREATATQRVVCVVSGGNVDEDYLSEVLEDKQSEER